MRAYLKFVKLPYLSWDNYSLSDGEMQQSFYDNLDIVRKLTLEAGIPFWNCILATALFRYMEPSDATFNLQVYGTLAYGGRGIQYFRYFATDNGNYRLVPVVNTVIAPPRGMPCGASITRYTRSLPR